MVYLQAMLMMSVSANVTPKASREAVALLGPMHLTCLSAMLAAD